MEIEKENNINNENNEEILKQENISNKDLSKINKEKIKEYKSQLNSQKFDVKNELLINENDDAVIECYVGQAKNILSKFDTIQDRTITDEFHQFLMEETEIIPIRYDLQLKIRVDDDFTEENEQQVKKAIKRFYSFKITRDKVRQKRTNLKGIMLFIVGMLCLCLIPFVAQTPSNLPLKEAFLIITWFFLWEATGTQIFDNNEIKSHKINMLRLYNADVIFVKPQK